MQMIFSALSESSGQVPVTPIGENKMYYALWEYRRNWLLSACACNTRQQENMRLTGSMRLIKSPKTRYVGRA